MIRAIALAVTFLVIPLVQARSQLRPLEAMQSRLYVTDANLAVEIGASRLFDERASLAGETGDLREVGNFSFA